MQVTGLIWTLYPLLGLFAVFEFTFGLAHVFFCLPFAHFYLSFWSGISAAITSVYALLLDYPNKCELLLQFVSVFFAFGLSLTAVAETVCIRRVRLPGGQISLCAGLLNRTSTSQLQCERVLGQFQHYLLDKVSSLPVDQSLHSARLFLSSLIAICAVCQFLSGLVLFVYSARSNRFRLTSSHWHCILGLLVLLLSVVHSEYCSPLFFAHLIPIVGVYSLLFALLPRMSSGNFVFRQFLAIFGAGLATSLAALATFSLFCWANQPPRITGVPPYRPPPPDNWRRNGPELGVVRFCQYPAWLYDHCERVLDFSFPYLDWAPEQVENEKAIVRLVAHCLLGACALGLIQLFMAGAFCAE